MTGFEFADACLIGWKKLGIDQSQKTALRQRIARQYALVKNAPTKPVAMKPEVKTGTVKHGA